MNTLEFLSELRQLGIQINTDGDKLRCNAPKGQLTSSLRSELAERKAEIIALLQDSKLAGNSISLPIQPVSRNQELPLSFAQQRLWFLDRLEPNSPFYNIAVAVRLSGDLKIQVLQQALDAIVAHHEILRTNYTTENGNPIQVINAPQSVELQIIDLQQYGEIEQETQIQKLLQQESQRPFNLASDMMLRGCLLQLAAREHVLLLVMHHIASDAWSMGILWEQLTQLYQAFLDDKPHPLEKLPIQYADYALWQREWLTGEVLDKQLNYWKQQLAGANPVLELPTDRPRPAVQTYRGASQSVVIPKTLTQSLKQLSRQEGVTLYITLLAAFQTLLYRYIQQEDIIVGSPIAGRNRAELEGLIGFFVNTLVLRTDLSGNPSFQELLGRVRSITLEAYSHQDLPFEKLVEELNPERSLSYNPLFQVMFVLQNAPGQASQLLGLTETPLQLETETAKFDLSLSLAEKDEELVGSWNYNTDLFDAATIERMMGHFEILLEGIVANPQQPIAQLPLLTPAERKQLLVEWNDTATEYPQKCIHQLFEEQVELTPDKVAVVFEDQQLTYRELNTRANQLAHHLQDLGVKPETLVGICVERSLDTIVSILAILKTGGAYVPIDISYPSERISFMLDDTKLSILLTQSNLLDILPKHQAYVVCLDRDQAIINQESKGNLDVNVTADNLAYVMYTSGSTGKPKGVQVIHRGVVRLVKSANYVNLSSKEVLLLLAPISFDASTLEIWGSLLNGARLIIFPADTPSLDDLGQIIRQKQVTTMWLTASLFHLMVDEHLEALKPLRQLLAGGDVLSVPHVKKFLSEVEDCKLINGYGPTENTTFTCCYEITKDTCFENSIPIGRPINNTQVYILDSQQQPVSVGVPGELYAGGDGLARGYLNRNDLTNERFIVNPFVGANSRLSPRVECLYKTGDLVRYLPDGNIEFLGRIDNQVKIRGFRIELGEIEAAIAQYPNVKENVVILREDQPGEKRVVAYVVLNQKAESASRDLTHFCKQKVPDYLVPSAFVVLDALPLTHNGKCDRRALPAPDTSRQDSKETFIASRDDLERKLTKIWEEVLGVEPIGIRDNFFELGGSSLSAIKLFNQIQKVFNKKIPISEIFQAPTVEEFAVLLSQNKSLAKWTSLVPVKPEGSNPPLFCIHSVEPSILHLRHIGQYLDSEQPFYCLQPPALNGDENSIFDKFEDMAAHYINEIQMLQPEGPYFLIGHSMGGLVAYEIACQLENQGYEIAFLGLIDTYAPVHQKKLPLNKPSIIDKLYIHYLNISKVQLRRKLGYILERGNRIIPKFIWNNINKSALSISDPKSNKLPEIYENMPIYRTIKQAHYKAHKAYFPNNFYSGEITLYRSIERPTKSHYNLSLGWDKQITQKLEVHDMPGHHNTLVLEPNVRILARKMQIHINEKILENQSKIHK